MQSVVRSCRRVCQIGFRRTLSSYEAPIIDTSIDDSTVATVTPEFEGFVRSMKESGSRASRKMRLGNN